MKHTSPSEVFEVVKNNILEILPKVTADMVTPEHSLSELGANSVDRMEVITLSMAALTPNIALLSFSGRTTIRGTR